jgi:CBS domain-containing protein
MPDPHRETIESHIRPPYRTLEAHDPVRVAYRRMEADHVRTLVVVRNETYVGVVDWQTIRRLPSDQMSASVGRFVRTDVPVLRAGTTIADAMGAFESTDVTVLGLLPVVAPGGKLAGQLEREEFQALMTDASGNITVPRDPVEHLLSGPNMPEPGAKVVSSDGRKLGTFQRHLEDRGRARWIEVRHGLLWKRKLRRVPLVAIERQSTDEIVLNIDVAIWRTFTDTPKRPRSVEW